MPPNEFELIEGHFKNLTRQPESVRCGIGDDAAILSIPPGHELLVSTDTLVSEVHFAAVDKPFDIGHKALAVNLSDMAAMAATPSWLTLSLTLPKPDHDWLTHFSRGLAGLAEKYDLALIGGDLSRGPLSITVQIMGTAAAGQATRRSGARVGDGIYVSGTLGCAALALSVLQGRQQGKDIDDCLLRLRRPEPRVAAGQALSGFASAAIDVSDGLAGDLAHLLDASAVSAVVELGAIPVCEKLAGVGDADERWRLALAQGDDYELCFTVPAARASEVQARLAQSRCSVKKIGRITEGQGIKWLLESGEEYTLAFAGYQHFPGE